MFAHRCPAEIDPVAVMHQSVEDGIGERRLVEIGMPLIDGQLAGDERRFFIIAII